jgi:hypothetical protein
VARSVVRIHALATDALAIHAAAILVPAILHVHVVHVGASHRRQMPALLHPASSPHIVLLGIKYEAALKPPSGDRITALSSPEVTKIRRLGGFFIHERLASR